MQKPIEKALEYTRKLRATANRARLVVCNEDKVDAVEHKWKWGDELPIVDQCTCLGVDISKDCSWDAHIAEVLGKGESQFKARWMRS